MSAFPQRQVKKARNISSVNSRLKRLQEEVKVIKESILNMSCVNGCRH